mgnify:FL=1
MLKNPDLVWIPALCMVVWFALAFMSGLNYFNNGAKITLHPVILPRALIVSVCMYWMLADVVSYTIALLFGICNGYTGTLCMMHGTKTFSPPRFLIFFEP